MVKPTKPSAVIATPATVTTAGTAKPQLIASVKAGLNLKGARAKWYAVLLTYQGKPAADFLAHCTATPPSLPKSGIPEKASGWLRYFTRTGIATLN